MNLRNAPANIAFNISSYFKLDRLFHPDLVITDFESFAYLYALNHGIPAISIDNMQVMDRCRLDIKVPAGELDNQRIARNIIKTKVPFCKHFFISSFFDAAISKKNTSIIPPIIRDEIIASSTSDGNHIIVYQTSTSQTDLIKILTEVTSVEFRVYGFNREEDHGHVKLKKFSEYGFIADLATAAVVIANGGYSLIREAVYLHKPVLSFPILNQFEQFVNAAYLEKNGFGMHTFLFNSMIINEFIQNIPIYSQKLNTYRQDGNRIAFEKLDQYLNTFA